MSYPITLVANDIYRGPEPVTSEDIQWVRTHCKTVIQLDAAKHYALTPAQIISYPISFWQMHIPWCAMPGSVLDYLVTLLDNVPKPAYVHCLEGIDRTGLEIAGYRVKIMGWSADLAYEEALHYGYHRILNQGLNKTWKEFNLNLKGESNVKP